jgi:hypothetical protein
MVGFGNYGSVKLWGISASDSVGGYLCHVTDATTTTTTTAAAAAAAAATPYHEVL